MRRPDASDFLPLETKIPQPRGLNIYRLFCHLKKKKAQRQAVGMLWQLNHAMVSQVPSGFPFGHPPQDGCQRKGKLKELKAQGLPPTSLSTEQSHGCP